jgi:hypothetical protein
MAWAVSLLALTASSPAEFVDGQGRVMGEQEKAIEQMEIRRGWVTAEELLEKVVSALALLGPQCVSGFACRLKDHAILRGRILGQRNHAEPREANAQQKIGGIDVFCGEEFASIEGVLKAPGVGEQLRQVEADDLGVTRLIGSAVSRRLLQVAERVLIGGGFLFAEPAQGHGRRGRGLQLGQPVEGFDGLRVLVCLVLQKAEIEPSLSPVGFELLGFRVEVNSFGDVALIAC